MFRLNGKGTWKIQIQPMLEIKINLREIRKQKGLTQKELAKFSNVLGYSEERTEKDMQEAEDKQR